MPDYALILDRLINTPLLAHPDKAQAVTAAVLRRGGVAFDPPDSVVNVPKPVASRFAAGLFTPAAGPLQESVLRHRHERADGKCFLFAPDLGIALIEITGSLAHRQWHVGNSSGIMGYDGIGAQLDAALADRAVRAIVLDIHSAGGEVPGCMQLADRIAAARGVKPVIAIADEMAFSAAYCLAAGCREIWLAAETAQVGSVGVVTLHVSFAEALKAEGVRVTIIQEGARKADGNPYQDLPDDVRDRIQGRLGLLYDAFVTRVALWRRLSANAVRATEADIFMGRDAVEVGFADGIAAPLEVIDALAAEIRAAP